MTSRWPKITKTFEIIKIAQQVVQKMTSERPKTVKTSKTVESLNISEIVSMCTSFLSYC